MELWADGKMLAWDQGELQLTDYGLSGIPIFQISRYGARALDAGKRVKVYVDFMPSWEEKESLVLLKKRARSIGYKPAGELFTGMLNRKLGQVLLKLSGINAAQPVSELSGKQLERLLGQLKHYEAIVMSVRCV